MVNEKVQFSKVMYIRHKISAKIQQVHIFIRTSRAGCDEYAQGSLPSIEDRCHMFVDGIPNRQPVSEILR